MKKLLLVMMCLAMAGLMKAQHCDSIHSHDVGWFDVEPSEITQLNNETLLIRSLLFDADEGNPIGQLFHTVSCNDLSITDFPCTLGNDLSFHLLTRLTSESGLSVLDASIIRDEENGKSYLKIAFLDEQLNPIENSEVTVLLTDYLVESQNARGCMLLDSHNDIIVQYAIPSRHETHFARFGLDGTLKLDAAIPESILPVYQGQDGSWQPDGLRQFSDSPLRYNFYGKNIEDFIALELDSEFNVINQYYLAHDYHNYPNTQTNGSVNAMLSLEDGGALIVRNTQFEGGNKATGIVRYDHDGNVVKEVWCTPFADPTHTVSFCTDMQKDSNGNIYLLLNNPMWDAYQIAVIKVDKDLNPVSEYRGMYSHAPFIPMCMTLLDNGSVAVAGTNYLDPNGNTLHTGLFAMILNFNNEENSENEITVRPYAFFPNPVEDQLSFLYSPDVKPSNIELYDIQGRLIRSYRNNLENLNMNDLPTGTYTMHVTMENGTSFTDKVLKK